MGFFADHRLPRAPRGLLSVCLFLAALSACALGRPEHEDAELTRRVTPELRSDDQGQSGPESTPNAEQLELAPRVPLDSDEKLFQVLNANLDLDSNDEQILVVRKKDDPEGQLELAVIDYDPVRGSYARTWEGPTQATNLRLFEISLKDLVGDHNLEIVCRGMNSEGELTLDVFRKTPSPTGLGLYFTEICEVVSDGSIEINEFERSEGYRMGQKNGPSFVITAYSQDRESENLLDRVKYTYRWQYQQNRYVLTSVEKLPGAVIEERQLQELFADTSVERFEEFLAGPWYLGNAEGDEEILLFSPEERRISIYSGRVTEIYGWQASFRSLSNRLLIFGVNEAIESIVKRFTIEVVSLNTIDVAILGSEQWDRSYGRYLKLGEELQESLLAEDEPQVRAAQLELSGLYQSGQGIEIIFDPPDFTWIDETSAFSGGFTIINLDTPVLYLQAIEDNGLPGASSAYIMDYSEKQEGNYLYRTLVLTPARLSVLGVEATSEKRITFEQLQILEETEETEESEETEQSGG
ncbi:MAG: pallilysin-related adhesin [Spirochaetales bacterium]|nr:pallilysin-related adhesin [Spirochaetales bacterium]